MVLYLKKRNSWYSREIHMSIKGKEKRHISLSLTWIFSSFTITISIFVFARPKMNVDVFHKLLIALAVFDNLFLILGYFGTFWDSWGLPGASWSFLGPPLQSARSHRRGWPRGLTPILLWWARCRRSHRPYWVKKHLGLAGRCLLFRVGMVCITFWRAKQEHSFIIIFFLAGGRLGLWGDS